MDLERWQQPHLSSAIVYRDPKRMLAWLERAFGFRPMMIISDAEGNVAHSEMVWGDSRLMVGSEWSGDHSSPTGLGGKNTQTVHVQMTEDIDAHCNRARAAGAEILMEPVDQFYGDRTYRARDPEGHIWTFGQTVRQVPPEEWDAESGLTTTFPTQA